VIRIHSCILLLSAASLAAAPCVVWDLGYTLVRPSNSVLKNFIGVGDYLFYTVFDGGSSDGLQEKVFSLLESLEGCQSGDYIAYTHTGIPMPQSLISWQSGTRSGIEILDEAKASAEQWYTDGLFSNSREYRLVKNALTIMLNPKILGQSMKPIKKMVKLMKKLDAAGVEQYILSNWDPASFEYLTQSDACSEIFALVPPSHRMISGHCGITKPDAAIYELFCTTHGKNPEECIIIDDQKENCTTAESLGMKVVPVNYREKNYREIKDQLEDFGLLREKKHSVASNAP
jgi:HAD superfamily hydrolase (TIGR01509 family)